MRRILVVIDFISDVAVTASGLRQGLDGLCAHDSLR